MSTSCATAAIAPGPLAKWIASIQLVALDSNSHTVTRPPDSATRLVVRTDASDQPEALVLGPRTNATYHLGDKPISVSLDVRIRPGCAGALLGCPVDELTDRVLPLSDLCPAASNRLATVVQRHSYDPRNAATAVLDALDMLIGSVAGRRRGEAELVRAACKFMSAQVASWRSVAHTAQASHLSERQLRQLFHRAVGLSPKRFLRIERVRAVLRDRSDSALARRAADHGYYDQSHLTTEFRATMGITRGAFRA